MNGQLIAGATSQNYTPTQSGIYVVRITDANGCVYEYSPGYNFTSATGIKQIEKTEYSIYPIPSTGLINISDVSMSGKRFEIYVYDVNGRLLVQNKTIYQLNLSEFGNGIYTIVIKPENAEVIRHKVIISQ